MTTTTEILRTLADLGIRLEARDGRLSVTGPREALTDELRQTLRAHRDSVLRFLQEQQREDAERTPPIGTADRSGRVPASRAQHRMWLSEQLAEGLPVYNMYFGVELQGDLDVAALRWAVGELVDRHEILRTSLTQADGELVQSIDPKCPVPFHQHVSAPDEVNTLVRSLVEHSFDLSRAPLSRFDLIGTGPRRWILLVVQHHAVSDGWSTGILKRELAELYRARIGRRPELPELPLQYADFAHWEEQWLTGPAAERQREFWRGALTDLPAALDLMPGRGRGTDSGHRGAALEFRYDEELLDRLDDLCAETGTTAYTVLLSAYSLLLARLSRTDDVVVGSPLANRPHTDLERALGLFFNLVPVRTRVDEQLTTREFLASARHAVHAAFAHGELPFDQVVQAAGARREGGRSPVFQTVFLFQTFPDTEFELPGVRVTPVDVPTYSTQYYDIMFRLSRHEDGLHGLLTYSDRQFTEGESRRFADAYRTLLDGMCRTPDRPLSELGVLDPESAGLLARWNAATACPVPERPVHEDILARLAQEPQRPALTFRGTTLTRGDLLGHTASVAAGLRAAGLRPGARVGILVPRAPELVAVVLGVMSAGMVYVLLDGAAPESLALEPWWRLRTAPRLSWTTSTVGPARFSADRCCTCRAATHPGRRSGTPGHDRVGVRHLHLRLHRRPQGRRGHPRQPRQPLHRPRRRRPAGRRSRLAVRHRDHLRHRRAGAAVDTGTGHTRLVLCENMETLRRSGADADGAEPMASDLTRSFGATGLQATPTLLRSVLALPHAAKALGSLRILLVGGEPLDLTLARELKALGIPRIVNMYGPTETTVWSSAWEVPDSPERVLVGRPLANTALYVTDAQLNPLPVGMYGELVIGGAGVALGYVGKPELTSARFPSRRALHADGPVYRTGDLARLLPDGTVELSGRLDNQIKHWGHRIELEDIEQAVNSVPGVAQCAVVLQGENPRALVAHYVPRPGVVLDGTALRSAVARLLQAAMVPSVFAPITRLPTTSSGKVDRRALPVVRLDRPDAAAEQQAHELEERLEIWRRVLGVDGLRVTDDFFRSGGSSLLVVRLLSEVRASVHPGAGVVEFFEYPSVRAYAAHLADAQLPLPGGTPQPRIPAGGQRQRMRQAAQRRRERAG